MTTLLHISKENIDHNSRNPNGPILPVIQTHDEQGEHFGHEAVIYDKDGLEAARIVYCPNNPLPTGALVWIEAAGRVELK